MDQMFENKCDESELVRRKNFRCHWRKVSKVLNKNKVHGVSDILLTVLIELNVDKLLCKYASWKGAKQVSICVQEDWPTWFAYNEILRNGSSKLVVLPVHNTWFEK